MDSDQKNKQTHLEYLNMYLVELANADRLDVHRKLVLLENFITAFKKNVKSVSQR
jgi:5-methylcytosine-specific restriction endonuclease McrBC regulatory subunit McrC